MLESGGHFAKVEITAKNCRCFTVPGVWRNSKHFPPPVFSLINSDGEP